MLFSYHPLCTWLLLFACFVLLLDVMVLVKMQSPYVLPKILKEDYISTYLTVKLDVTLGVVLTSMYMKV